MAATAATSEPSYMIVNKQLRDVVRAQETTIARLVAMCQSNKEDLVPREEYERLSRQLEDEKLEHMKTKAKLAGESEKLQFALGEVDILNKQLQREKTAFEKAFGSLKNKAQMKSQERDDLLNKCEEMEVICHKQDDVLTAKESKIKDLKMRLAKQKENHKKQLSDLEIQREQERYIVLNTLAKDENKVKRKKRVTFR
ncbi:spermatogenesis-associated protein 24 [Nematostella vectensis]|nr:spermatogenesis-associated protein 24 [Nematostella vectensis]